MVIFTRESDRKEVILLEPVMWIRNRIQHFSSESGTDPIRIQGFDGQKLKKKNTAEKICFLSFF